MDNSTTRRLSFALGGLAASCALAGVLSAQIQNLDGPWQYGLYPEAQVGTHVATSMHGTPASGTHVKLQAATAVAENWRMTSASGVQCNASKPLSVGPLGQRLTIDTRLRGELSVADLGGRVHVNAQVCLFRFNDPTRGPAGGVHVYAGPGTIARSVRGASLVDRSSHDDIWLEPGEYTLSVRLRVTVSMTAGLGGDRAHGKFIGTSGGEEDRFDATFTAQPGQSMPRSTLRPFSFGSTKGARHDLGDELRRGTGVAPSRFGGVGRDEVGSYFVTEPGLVARGRGLALFDASGGFVRTVALPPIGPTFTPLRATDLAIESSRLSSARTCLLYTSFDDRVLHCFDAVRQAWNSSGNVRLDPAVPVAALTALAFDPDGAGGQGAFWLAGANGPLVEVGRDGRPRRVLPMPLSLREIRGASHDPTEGSIWWFGRDLDDHAVSIEMRVHDARITGKRIALDRDQPAGHDLIGGDVASELQGAGLLWATVSGASTQVEELDLRFEFGTSCGSRAGLAGSAAIGDALRLKLGGAESAVAVALIAFAPDALPIPGVLAPDCRLWLDVGSALALPGAAVTGGQASAWLDLPPRPGLRGISVYAQWLELGFGSLPLQSSTAVGFTIR